MIVIRNEQLRAFQKAAEQRFVRETCARLRQDWPEEMQRMMPAQLEQAVRGAVSWADELGVETKRGAAQVINVLFALNDGRSLDPEPHPWMREILDRPDLPEEHKISALLERAGEVLDEAED